MKYNGEKAFTIIGENVTIRESVTINRGTTALGQTVVGDNVLLMACTHVAHDCIVGNNTIMANLATLGGHVEIGEWANIEGVVIHQFVKIGEQSLIGGGFCANRMYRLTLLLLPSIEIYWNKQNWLNSTWFF